MKLVIRAFRPKYLRIISGVMGLCLRFTTASPFL
jgi:hypothetical protein